MIVGIYIAGRLNRINNKDTVNNDFFEYKCNREMNRWDSKNRLNRIIGVANDLENSI